MMQTFSVGVGFVASLNQYYTIEAENADDAKRLVLEKLADSDIWLCLDEADVLDILDYDVFSAEQCNI